MIFHLFFFFLSKWKQKESRGVPWEKQKPIGVNKDSVILWLNEWFRKILDEILKMTIENVLDNTLEKDTRKDTQRGSKYGNVMFPFPGAHIFQSYFRNNL